MTGKQKKLKISYVLTALFMLASFVYANARVSQASDGMDAFRKMFYLLSVLMGCCILGLFFWMRDVHYTGAISDKDEKNAGHAGQKADCIDRRGEGAGYRADKKLSVFFIISSLTLGIAYNIMVPVMAAPDEAMHLSFVYELSERMLGWDTEGNWDTHILREAEAESNLEKQGIVHEYYNDYFSKLVHDQKEEDTQEVCLQETNTQCEGTQEGYAQKSGRMQEECAQKAESTQEEYAQQPESTQEQEEPLVEVAAGFSNNTEVPKLLYLPGALGITVGRLLGLDAVPTLLLGRLFNLVLFLLLGLLTVRLLPVGKELFIAVTLLPMTVQEINSFSCDSMMLGLAFLDTALLVRLLYEKNDYGDGDTNEKHSSRRKWIDLILAIGISYLLSWCKYGACMPLCLLLFVTAHRLKREEKNKAYVAAIGGTICILGAFLPSVYLIFHTNVLQNSASSYYTVSEIFGDLPHTFLLLGNTVCRYMDHYVYSLIGTSLGYFELHIPVHLGIVLLFLVIALALTNGRRETIFSKKEKLFVVLLCLLGAAFAVGGMIIGCTPSGSEVIEGVQGRYFLPYLLLVLLLIEPRCIEAKEPEALRGDLLCWMLVVQFAVVMCLFIRAF